MSVSIPYTFEVYEELKGFPDEIRAFPLTLPDGRRARFLRITDWEVPNKEVVSETSAPDPESQL